MNSRSTADGSSSLVRFAGTFQKKELLNIYLHVLNVSSRAVTRRACCVLRHCAFVFGVPCSCFATYISVYCGVLSHVVSCIGAAQYDAHPAITFLHFAGDLLAQPFHSASRKSPNLTLAVLQESVKALASRDTSEDIFLTLADHVQCCLQATILFTSAIKLLWILESALRPAYAHDAWSLLLLPGRVRVRCGLFSRCDCWSCLRHRIVRARAARHHALHRGTRIACRGNVVYSPLSWDVRCCLDTSHIDGEYQSRQLWSWQHRKDATFTRGSFFCESGNVRLCQAAK